MADFEYAVVYSIFPTIVGIQADFDEGFKMILYPKTKAVVANSGVLSLSSINQTEMFAYDSAIYQRSSAHVCLHFDSTASPYL